MRSFVPDVFKRKGKGWKTKPKNKRDRKALLRYYPAIMARGRF